MFSVCNSRTWNGLKCQMYISRIIHCRPPTTIEKYLQEIGRASRIGAKCTALIYFNNNDIVKNRKGLRKEVIQCCKNSEKTALTPKLKVVGFKESLCLGPVEECCSERVGRLVWYMYR